MEDVIAPETKALLLLAQAESLGQPRLVHDR